jgi:predicted phosphodiesterase
VNLATTLELTVPDRVETIALCGGPYSNFAAVDAFLAATADLPHRYCLGDLGGFGPHPDRTVERIRAAGVVCVRGNYDHAVGFDQRDCGCGYVDPVDRATAQVSFDYTAAHTSATNKEWLRTLPTQVVLAWRGLRVLLVHGSPDEVNEFVWDSETGDTRIDAWLERERVDGICATHSGVPWIRTTARGFWCNVGVLGRPAHDGTRRVGYARVRFPAGAPVPHAELVPLDYDVAPVAAAMRAEGLPDAFARALELGVWTTCASILPPAERVIADRYRPVSPSPHPTDSHARDPAAAQAH